jgi:hypothetical protein
MSFRAAGNRQWAYKNPPRVPNPTNDTQDVSGELKRSGFDTIVGIDLDKAGMDDAVRAAGDSLAPLGGRARDRHRRDSKPPSCRTTKTARGNGQAEILASSSLGSRNT